MLTKFATNTCGAIWWPNVEVMHVPESISGSVVPLAMSSSPVGHNIWWENSRNGSFGDLKTVQKWVGGTFGRWGHTNVIKIDPVPGIYRL